MVTSERSAIVAEPPTSYVVYWQMRLVVINLFLLLNSVYLQHLQQLILK